MCLLLCAEPAAISFTSISISFRAIWSEWWDSLFLSLFIFSSVFLLGCFLFLFLGVLRIFGLVSLPCTAFTLNPFCTRISLSSLPCTALNAQQQQSVFDYMKDDNAICIAEYIFCFFLYLNTFFFHSHFSINFCVFTFNSITKQSRVKDGETPILFLFSVKDCDVPSLHANSFNAKQQQNPIHFLWLFDANELLISVHAELAMWTGENGREKQQKIERPQFNVADASCIRRIEIFGLCCMWPQQHVDQMRLFSVYRAMLCATDRNHLRFCCFLCFWVIGQSDDCGIWCIANSR